VQLTLLRTAPGSGESAGTGTATDRTPVGDTTWAKPPPTLMHELVPVGHETDADPAAQGPLTPTARVLAFH